MNIRQNLYLRFFIVFIVGIAIGYVTDTLIGYLLIILAFITGMNLPIFLKLRK